MYKNRQEKKLNFKRQVYIALVVNLPILRISEGVVFSVILELCVDYSAASVYFSKIIVGSSASPL